MQKAISMCFMIKRSVAVSTAAVSSYTFVRLCTMLYTHHLSYTTRLLCDDMGNILSHVTEGNRPRDANSLLSGEAQTQKLSCEAKPVL